jgi:hypothetical protein
MPISVVHLSVVDHYCTRLLNNPEPACTKRKYALRRGEGGRGATTGHTRHRVGTVQQRSHRPVPDESHPDEHPPRTLSTPVPPLTFVEQRARSIGVKHGMVPRSAGPTSTRRRLRRRRLHARAHQRRPQATGQRHGPGRFAGSAATITSTTSIAATSITGATGGAAVVHLPLDRRPAGRRRTPLAAGGLGRGRACTRGSIPTGVHIPLGGRLHLKARVRALVLVLVRVLVVRVLVLVRVLVVRVLVLAWVLVWLLVWLLVLGHAVPHHGCHGVHVPRGVPPNGGGAVRPVRRPRRPVTLPWVPLVPLVVGPSGAPALAALASAAATAGALRTAMREAVHFRGGARATATVTVTVTVTATVTGNVTVTVNATATATATVTATATATATVTSTGTGAVTATGTFTVTMWAPRAGAGAAARPSSPGPTAPAVNLAGRGLPVRCPVSPRGGLAREVAGVPRVQEGRRAQPGAVRRWQGPRHERPRPNHTPRHRERQGVQGRGPDHRPVVGVVVVARRERAGVRVGRCPAAGGPIGCGGGPRAAAPFLTPPS